MARKRYLPDDPREWLNRARNNLARAVKLKSPDYLEDNCFDAQQAAEKSIKAVFVHRGEKFPYIHNLGELLKLLEKSGVKVPKYIRQAHDLTPYAAESRYPGTSAPVTVRDHRRAVRIAGSVLRWATRLIEGR